ncbi:MAG: hypothetical protein H8E46_06920 [FCB group bacterium]|nr:hypothetical protein [FCB group bacterium]
MSINNYQKNVFINCPFDDQYLGLLRPLLFTIIYLDYYPRISSERFNSAEIRVDKICEFIDQCKYSIHDLSRIESQSPKELARFNMPFELGIDFGCRLFGKGKHDKIFLILEKERYRYQKSLSDLSGIDITNHNDEPEEIIRCLRNWFAVTNLVDKMPSSSLIWDHFNVFWTDFEAKKTAMGFKKRDIESMPSNELINSMRTWIEDKLSD